MGLFDKIKASVGIGGAKVELELEPGSVPRGGYAKGQVIVRAGKLEQKCNGVIVELKRTKVVRQSVEGKMQDVNVTDTLAEENLAQYEQDLRPGDEFRYNYSIMVPDEGGEEQRVTYELRASADIPGAIDPSDTKKVPTSAPQAVTLANVPALLDTAVSLERAGGDKSAQLQGVLKQILTVDATNTQALKMLARHLSYSAAAEAATYFRKYLEQVPADGEMWQEFAQSTFDRGSFEEALGYSDKATELMPNSAYAWQHRARILDKLGRVDDAVKSLEKSKQGDYPSNRLDVEKAQLLQRAGRMQEAAAAFLAAGKNGDPYTLEDVLEGLRAAGEAGHDNELIELAKQKDPEQYWAWQVHAKWVVDSSPEEAIKAVDAALTKNVSSDWSRADLWVLKGRALEKLERKPDAKVAYEKALQECKDHHDAKTRLKSV